MANGKRELAEAISGFFSVYAPEKRRQKEDKKDEERWQAYYKLQEGAATRAQEQHTKMMRQMDKDWLDGIEEGEQKKALREWFFQKHGMTPEQHELNEKAVAAERAGVLFGQDQEMFPLKKDLMSAQIGAANRSGRGGGYGSMSPLELLNYQIAQERLGQMQGEVPDIPSLLAMNGDKEGAVLYGSAQRKYKELDDALADMTREKPHPTMDPTGYEAWQQNYQGIKTTRDQVGRSLSQMESRAARLYQGGGGNVSDWAGVPYRGNMGEADLPPAPEPEMPGPLPEVWKSRIIEPQKGLIERFNDVRRRDMGMAPVESVVGPPVAPPPAPFQPFTGGQPAMPAQPGVAYQLRDPNLVNPINQFFGPLNRP